jgi:hypothetical protein
MSYRLRWTDTAEQTFNQLQAAAEQAQRTRQKAKKKKSSKQEGLFKQVAKAVEHLASNPRHPGLATHEYHSLENPYDPGEKVFEAYAQQHTPGAYRIFWCYGPDRKEITILAITPHP